MIKIVIGIGIIIASFIYIMVNHDKSMLENLREKGMKKMEKKEMEEARAKALEAGTEQPAAKTEKIQDERPEQ